MIEPDITYVCYKTPSGDITHEIWHCGGLLHNIDSPAKIIYYNDGTIRIAIYAKHGKIYRENYPAITMFDVHGRISAEFYAIDNLLHNDHGPAIVVYNGKGEIVYTANRINGINPAGQINDEHGQSLENTFYDIIIERD